LTSSTIIGFNQVLGPRLTYGLCLELKLLIVRMTLYTRCQVIYTALSEDVFCCTTKGFEGTTFCLRGWLQNLRLCKQ